MAYDSATATQMAGDAYKRAVASAQQQRASLEQGYGLNDDGSLDGSAAGRLGSLYQGNLASVNKFAGSRLSDRRRGFGSTGLGAKESTAANQDAQDTQAVNFRNANAALGANTQAQQQAGQDYQDQLGTIGSQSAWDLAQTLAANPVQAAPTPTQPLGSNYNGVAGAISPAQAAAQRKALAVNPRAAQTARNRF